MASKFFYFGFGSNMLASRIHIQNPTAQRIGAGKLKVSGNGNVWIVILPYLKSLFFAGLSPGLSQIRPARQQMVGSACYNSAHGRIARVRRHLGD